MASQSYVKATVKVCTQVLKTINVTKHQNLKNGTLVAVDVDTFKECFSTVDIYFINILGLFINAAFNKTSSIIITNRLRIARKVLFIGSWTNKLPQNFV